MPLILNEKLTELVAQRFRLLGEPTRLRILQALEAGELTVNEIASALGSSQPNISKHLQALSQAGLINRRREGINIYYAIADPMVFKLCDLVCRSATAHTRAQLAEIDVPARPAAGKSSRNGR